MPGDIQEAFVEQESGPESHQEIFGWRNLGKDTISWKSTKEEKCKLLMCVCVFSEFNYFIISFFKHLYY